MNIAKIIGVLLVTTITGSLGALGLKQGMNEIEKLSVVNVIRSKSILLGAVFYVVSALTNIMLLDLLDYSIAYPMTSLSYVWTVIISYFVFNEKITARKVIAVALIVAGLFIMNM